MAKSPTSEIFATLRTYATKLSDGERSPSEIATALNDWAHESAESVKARIHDEVEMVVSKMGFIKRDEFDALERRLKALEGGKKASVKKAPAKKSAAKKTVVKKSAVKKVAKKKVVKK